MAYNDHLHRKRMGIYYTPSILTSFAAKHLLKYYIPKKNGELLVLEPSVGDGKFIVEFVKARNELLNIDIVDLDKKNLSIASQSTKKILSKGSKVKSYQSDFLFFKSKIKYDLVIGNPPYVSKRDLTEKQISKSIEIQSFLHKSIPHEFKNLWTAFVIKSIGLLDKNGTICQVLPTELLHVKYTGVVRKFLLENFKRIEVFTFKNIIFDGTQQDVVLLFCSNSLKVKSTGISFYEVEKLEDLLIPDYTEKHSNVHRKNLEKWSNYILSDDEIKLIENLKYRLKFKEIISFVNKIEVGVVTAANDFFILDNEDIEEYELGEYRKKIIQKGSQVRDSIILNQKTLDGIEEKGGRTNLLCIPDTSDRTTFRQSLNDYILHGEELSLNNRFKMKKRNNWYHVPSKWVPNGFLLKRTHTFPRIFFNNDDILSTDALYMIDSTSKKNMKALCGTFYNILTFIDCELKGRYYGGGVLELTPNEFKSIELPYRDTGIGQLRKIDKYVKKNDFKGLIEFGFNEILYDLSIDDQFRLKLIYQKLLKRRLRKNAPNIAPPSTG